MKRLIFLLVVATGTITASAQTGLVKNYSDSLLPRWFIELNVMGGTLDQNLTLSNPSSFYTGKNLLNDTISALKFNNGSTMGYELGVGYFFGKKRHFGIGTGITYFSQTGNITLDKYHVEYQRTDSFGNPYRQVIYANGQIKEDINIQNINVPLLIKYRKRFSKLISFNADAGLLVNVQTTNSYKTNASFNYEAIRAFSNGNPVYDNNATPLNTDILQTEASFFHTHPDATMQQAIDHFNTLRSQGDNVGLNVTPTNASGNFSYSQVNFGFIVRPQIGFHITDNILINLGVYYVYQSFANSNNNNYHLTDKVGEYNSLLSSGNSNTSQSMGGSIGIRYYLSRNTDKDSDHDGVSNKKDRCPHDSGSIALNGCPDRDGDGIPDIDDSCADVAGLAKFFGCPDSDGDGIPDKNDLCPNKAGLAQFNGCPDSDGDGIPDNEDICPFQAGPIKFNGCPDTDGDGIPDNLDKCPNVPGPVENQGCPVETVKVENPISVETKTETKTEKKTKVEEPPVSKIKKGANPIDISSPKDKETPKVEKIKKQKEKKIEEDIPASSVRITAPILFEINKCEIRESSKVIIEEAVKKINANKDAYIVVEGYTDTTGPASYNKILSKLRANVLKKYLIEKGVQEDKIKSVGMGSREPIGDNNTHSGRMKNRRAEMKWGNKK